MTGQDKVCYGGTMTITHEVERLTPEDANRLLDRNTHNRPLNQGDILKWATEMEAGSWQMNGEPVKIAVDGSILDGQHRLHALALQDQGTEIAFLVVRGLPRSTQRTMDQGRKRSASDQMNLEGIQANGKVAASVRFFMHYHLDLLFRDRKAQDAEVTTPAIVEWSVANPERLELVRRAIDFTRIKARSAIVSTAYIAITETHGVDLADEFMGRMNDGVGLEDGSPILALRNRLDQARGETGRANRATRISDRDLLGMFFIAFNAWVTGKKLGKIQRPNGGAWTEETFPKVISQRSLKMSKSIKAVRAHAV